MVFIIFGAFSGTDGDLEFFYRPGELSLRFLGGRSGEGGGYLLGALRDGIGIFGWKYCHNGFGHDPDDEKCGYRPEFAGAVEAAASTGGQIMPPIMGAAAFLMAEYMGVPYATVALKAILPAVLYFAGIYIAVHLEAQKLRLRGIPREELPQMRVLMKQIYLLAPLIVLVVLVSTNTFTMQFLRR